MIFVTVGTHEQPFNRLVEYIDKLKKNNIIKEDVIIQIGYSTYKPKYCKWKELYSYQEMKKLIEEARIVITHGGPSSFIMPLQINKVPIVVPRKKEFNEHVNNHQVSFVKAVSERMGMIIIVKEIEELNNIIANYESIINQMKNGLKSNNRKFNDSLNKIVDEIFKIEE